VSLQPDAHGIAANLRRVMQVKWTAFISMVTPSTRHSDRRGRVARVDRQRRPTINSNAA
jgi:hypothetical protein